MSLVLDNKKEMPTNRVHIITKAWKTHPRFLFLSNQRHCKQPSIPEIPISDKETAPFCPNLYYVELHHYNRIIQLLWPWILTEQHTLQWPASNKLALGVNLCRLNNPCSSVQLTTVQTLQGGMTFNQIRTPWLADNL